MTEMKVNNLYFTNFQKCVDALNAFFQSGYKTKNFPMIEDEDSVEPTILHIMKWIDQVNPTWIDDSEKIEDALESINKIASNLDEDSTDDEIDIDQSTEDMINAFIAYKMLQFMADHKTDIESLFDGIYSMKLFTTPSEYADTIDVLKAPIKLNEIDSRLVDYLSGDEGYHIFDVKTYVDGIFHSEYIEVPDKLKMDTEIERINNCQDRHDIEIVVDDTPASEDVNESYVYTMERAEINFFEETNPPHIRYHENLKKWQISKQFTAAITRLLAGLKTCDTVDDVKEFLNTTANKINPDDYTCMVLPCILARVFANDKKFTNRVFVDDKALKKYTDSYDSIMKQNKGAQRFKNYDLFTVFKTDKEGTLQFLEDFLTLRLASDPNAYIKNHELMILFNIFDSRIYFDILYNVMPKSVQENEWQNEDNFVKTLRARLNKNSRQTNPYTDANKKPIDQQMTPELQSETDVTEYVCVRLSQYGDITLEDTRLCDDIVDMVHMELNSMNNRMYNEYATYHGEYILEANEESKKARKKAQEFMRKEYGTAHPTSMTSKQRNRMKTWLKDNDYDPETESIRTDIIDKKTGKPVRVKLGTKGANGASHSRASAYTRSMIDDASRSPVYSSDPKIYERVLKPRYDALGDMDALINMPKREMQRHPSMSNGISKHEEGHIADFQYGEKLPGTKEGHKIVKRARHGNVDLGEHAKDYEFGADVYSVQHNPYKDKLRFLNSVKSSDTINTGRDIRKLINHTQKAMKANDIDSLKMNIRLLIEQSNSNIDFWKSCNVNKNMISDAIKVRDEYQRILDNLDNKSFEEANQEFQKAIKKAILTNLDANIKVIDREADLRRMVAKKFIKEFALEYNMRVIDVIQEMYQTEFDDLVEDCFIQERMAAVNGDLPDYMKKRFQIDKPGDSKDEDEEEPETEDMPVPDGIPQNPIDDLADSVETRANVFGKPGNELDDAFGNEADVTPVDPTKPHKPGQVVYNITYNNSFNKTTNDMSENKTIRKNSHDIKHSNIKGGVGNNTPSNSNNNGTTSGANTSDTHDKDTSKNDVNLSTGHTVQEVFQMLYSEEPLFVKEAAVNNGPPKSDSLTRAIDLDRKTLAAQQAAKKGINKGINTVRAKVKPFDRAQDWLTKIVDSLIKRDEDKVKNELVDNASYRSIVFKASRIALKLGLVATAFAINPYIGWVAAAGTAAREYDKNVRLRKEVQEEFVTELKIIDERIKACDEHAYGASAATREAQLKEKARLMRLRNKMAKQAAMVTNSPIRNAKEFT